jgi:hypothetical protein
MQHFSKRSASPSLTPIATRSRRQAASILC